MIREFRIDRGDLKPLERDRFGNLWVEGVFAVPGVMTYYTDDGREVRELLDKETLSRADDIRGLRHVPVTNEHPPEDVTPKNYRKYGVGDVAGDVEVFVDDADGWGKVKFIVREEQTIRDVEDGKRRELSPGYMVVLDPTPGEHPVFGRYDARQVSRTYNHVAIVERARGGPEVKLRADSAIQILDGETVKPAGDHDPEPPKQPKNPRDKQRSGAQRGDSDMNELFKILMALTAGEITREDAQKQMLQAIRNDAKLGDIRDTAVQKMLDKLENQLSQKDKELEDMKKELDEFKAAKKDAEDNEPSDEEKAEALKKDRMEFAASRVPLLAEAKRHEMKDDDVSKLDNDELKEAIVRKVKGDSIPKDASAEFIAAAWVMLPKGDDADEDEANRDGYDPFAHLARPDYKPGDDKAKRKDTEDDNPYLVQQQHADAACGRA